MYIQHLWAECQCPDTTLNQDWCDIFAKTFLPPFVASSFASFQSTQLQANMERLKDEWAEFLKEQQRLKEEVDEEHAKAIGQVSTQYSEMKKDLTKLSPL